MWFTNKNKKTLHVVTALFNPENYHSRYALYTQFENRMLDNPNVILYTVECTYDNAIPFVKKRSKNHVVITVNSNCKLWLKENLLNIGFKHIPKNAEYVAWVDCDLSFEQPNWVEKTIKELQTHNFAQMFSEIVYLDKHGNQINKHHSLIWGWYHGACFIQDNHCYYYLGGRPDMSMVQGKWHGAPGGAWAFRKEFLDRIGGLYDRGIVGSGDSYTAFALLGLLCSSLTSKEFKYNTEYIRNVKIYKEILGQEQGGDPGLVDLMAVHYFHGNTKDRNYWYRNYILQNNDFNPNKDLFYNWDGVIQLKGTKPQLIKDLENYFQNRKEDANE